MKHQAFRQTQILNPMFSNPVKTSNFLLKKKKKKVKQNTSASEKGKVLFLDAFVSCSCSSACQTKNKLAFPLNIGLESVSQHWLHFRMSQGLKNKKPTLRNSDLIGLDGT